MTKVHQHIFFLLLVAILTCLYGCSKETRGEQISVKEYHFDSLRVINLKTDIQLVLVQDSLNMVRITAPEKMQEKLVPTIAGDTIRLENKNRSRLLGKYASEIIAEVHFTGLYYIFHQGGGTISNMDTIRLETFTLATNGANGDIGLTLDCDRVHLGFSTGSCRVNVSGRCTNLSVWSTSYCWAELDNLVANNVSIRNNSPVDHYIYVTDKLVSKAQYFGNIYYRGGPGVVDIEDGDKGKTIHVE